jgi:hypothetical protein
MQLLVTMRVTVGSRVLAQCNSNLSTHAPSQSQNTNLSQIAGTIPVANAIDVWRMCLRVTFNRGGSPPKYCIDSIRAECTAGCGKY